MGQNAHCLLLCALTTIVGQKRPNAYNAYDHMIRSCNINTLFPFLFYFSKVILFIIYKNEWGGFFRFQSAFKKPRDHISGLLKE